MNEDRELLNKFLLSKWNYSEWCLLKEEITKYLQPQYNDTKAPFKSIWKNGQIVGWYIDNSDPDIEHIGTIEHHGNNNCIGGPFLGVTWRNKMIPKVGTKLYIITEKKELCK